MIRNICKQLLRWKKENINMPLMIIGARQVGKTYIAKEFCEKEFLKNIYIENKSMDVSLHNKLIDLYRTYICIGGMPACVENYLKCNKDILKYNKEIIKNIINSYLNDMNKYVYNSFEATRIKEIYKTIPTQLENSSRKFQYSKIKKGARSKDYESALNWLYSSNLIHKCSALDSINIPPKAYMSNEDFKLFLSDIGY